MGRIIEKRGLAYDGKLVSQATIYDELGRTERTSFNYYTNDKNPTLLWNRFEYDVLDRNPIFSNLTSFKKSY